MLERSFERLAIVQRFTARGVRLATARRLTPGARRTIGGRLGVAWTGLGLRATRAASGGAGVVVAVGGRPGSLRAAVLPRLVTGTTSRSPSFPAAALRRVAGLLGAGHSRTVLAGPARLARAARLLAISLLSLRRRLAAGSVSRWTRVARGLSARLIGLLRALARLLRRCILASVAGLTCLRRRGARGIGGGGLARLGRVARSLR